MGYILQSQTTRVNTGQRPLTKNNFSLLKFHLREALRGAVAKANGDEDLLSRRLAYRDEIAADRYV